MLIFLIVGLSLVREEVFVEDLLCAGTELVAYSPADCGAKGISILDLSSRASWSVNSSACF